MRNSKYAAIVFLTGISVTAIEISAARLVAPFFGSTIYVWGSAIGVVLFGLAFGYYLGGRVIDRFTSKYSISLALALAGSSGLVVAWLYQNIGQQLSQWTSHQHIPIALGALCMMFILFFIPITAMGMVSPMVLRLAIQSVESAGSTSGLMSSMATIGSIIGTFASAFWTIPVFGTRLTIVVASCLLLVLAFWQGLPKKLHPKTVSMVLGFFVLLTIWQLMTTPMLARAGLQWEKESPYQLIQVLQLGQTRYLIHDAGFGTQSTYYTGQNFPATPYDIFGILPYLTPTQHQPISVLLLGLGGGNMPTLYHRLIQPNVPLSITAVEIDHDVVTAAEQYFDIQDANVNIVIDDARQFLRSTTKTFDIIIVDVYTHEMQIPPMLATQQFFQEIQPRLAPGGVVGMNALAFAESRYLPKLLTTIASVFPDTREATFTIDSPNHLVIAGQQLPVQRNSLVMSGRLVEVYNQYWPRLRRIAGVGEVYTDDRTDLELRVKPLL